MEAKVYAGKQAKPYVVSKIELNEGTNERKRYRWKVQASVKGKRVGRKFFKHGEEAKADRYAKELEEDYARLAEKDRRLLSGEVQEQALRALEALDPWGASIEEAVSFYVEHRQKTSDLNNTPMSRVIGLLRDQKDREEVSARYAQDLKNRLDKFERDFNDRPLSDISSDELEQWIEQRGKAHTQASFRRLVNVLYNFAKKKGFVLENPVDQIFKPKTKNDIGILSPEETQDIFTHVTPELTPAVAIAFFAGLRDAEIDRLEWKHIDLKRGLIRIDAHVSKTSNVRFVEITENLSAWLSPLAKRRGSVRPKNWRRQWEALREKAGLGAGKYPNNASRHSFASYHIALHGNEGETATQLGHSDLKMIRSNYKQLATPDDAESFFSIVPEGKENVVNFKKTA